MLISTLKENKIFAGILFLIFFAYLWLAWLPVENLLSGFLVDDAFYYFKPASNLAMGLGPTFDGEHLTNGYHPLWMGISVAVYYLFPGDKIFPIHLILTLSVLFFAGTVLLFRNIVSRLISDKLAVMILTLAFALNPWNVSNAMNGLETSLALFLLILLFWIFLRILDGKNSTRDFLWLGAVGGLMVLARLDYGLFLAAIFIYFIFSRRFSWQAVFAFFLPAFFLAAPWFLYNYFYFGSPIPASGLSYTLINHRLWFYKDRSVFQILLWSLYNLVGVIASNLKTIGLPVFYSAEDLWKSFWSLSAIFMPVIAMMVYFYAAKRNRLKEYLKSIAVSSEGLALFVFFIAYSGLVFVHGAIRWSGREWYFAGFPFLAVVLLSLLLSRIDLSAYRKKAMIFVSLLLGLSFYWSWGSVLTQYNGQREMYDTAVWVSNNLPSDVRLAAFNSGILGYFSDRYVMNSDGLINNSAFEALKENRLWELFEKERINYLADYEITLTYRFKSFLGIEDPMTRVEGMDLPIAPASSTDSYAGSHIGIFRLKQQ